MFVHDKFLFLHVPKTGGQTVRHILYSAGLGPVQPVPEPGQQSRNPHSGLHELPATLIGDRQVGICLREPCDWYRSYLHCNLHGDGTPNKLLAQLLNGEEFDLKHMLWKLTAPDRSTKEIDVLGITQPADATVMRRKKIGIYTWLVLYMVGSSFNKPQLRADHVIDTGQLRLGLQGWMAEHQINITGALKVEPDHNTNAQHASFGNGIRPYDRPVEEDFDKEMVEHVYERDRFIVDLMGYTGPGSTAKAALV